MRNLNKSYALLVGILASLTVMVALPLSVSAGCGCDVADRITSNQTNLTVSSGIKCIDAGVTVSGTILVKSGATLCNDGIINGVVGGSWSDEINGTINNYGSITVTNDDDWDEGTFNNYSGGTITFTNTGGTDWEGNATLVNSSGGTVTFNRSVTWTDNSIYTNSGSVSVVNGYFDIATDQTVTNNTGGTLDVPLGKIFTSSSFDDATIVNNGTVTVRDQFTTSCNNFSLTNGGSFTTSSYIQINDPATVINTGTITSAGYIEFNYVTTLTNSGTITVTSGNLQFDNFVTLTNNSGGNINIISGNFGADNGTTLENKSGAAITVSAGTFNCGGIAEISFTNAGTVTSSGNITMSPTGFAPDGQLNFTNSGTLTSTNGNCYLDPAKKIMSFSNTGSIVADGNIILGTTNGFAMINNGFIYGRGNASDLTLRSRFINQSGGRISVTGDFGLDGIANQNITNEDSITIGGDLLLTGIGSDTLHNYAGAYIYVCGGMTGSAIFHGVYNDGKIRIKGNCTWVAFGIDFDNTGELIVDGDITFDNYTDLTNSGTISLQGTMTISSFLGTTDLILDGGDIFCGNFFLDAGIVSDGPNNYCSRITISGTSSVTNATWSDLEAKVDIKDLSPGSSNGYNFDTGQSIHSGTNNSCSAGGTEGSYIGGGTCSEGLLPIDLLSFTANYLDGTVYLKWVTGSEINNDYFTIERSSDAHDFAPVHRVGGAGYSTSILHYGEMDLDPLPGTSYYRLKQTDYDGNYTYSEVRAVTDDNRFEEASMKIYPNPMTGSSFTISIMDKNKGKKVLFIYDSFGKIVLSNKQMEEGDKGFQTHVDRSLSNLTPGIYIVVVATDKKTYREKLVVSQ